jgi:hypothetical protein
MAAGESAEMAALKEKSGIEENERGGNEMRRNGEMVSVMKNNGRK